MPNDLWYRCLFKEISDDDFFWPHGAAEKNSSSGVQDSWYFVSPFLCKNIISWRHFHNSCQFHEHSFQFFQQLFGDVWWELMIHPKDIHEVILQHLCRVHSEEVDSLIQTLHESLEALGWSTLAGQYAQTQNHWSDQWKDLERSTITHRYKEIPVMCLYLSPSKRRWSSLVLILTVTLLLLWTLCWESTEVFLSLTQWIYFFFITTVLVSHTFWGTYLFFSC